MECEPSYRVQRLGRALRHRLLECLRPYGVTPEQYRILARLVERDGLPQADLAEPGFDDRTNITHLLNQLERGRLVERRRDEADGRRRQVWLTNRGRELVTRLTEDVERVKAAPFAGLTDVDRATLLDLFDRIEAAL